MLLTIPWTSLMARALQYQIVNVFGISFQKYFMFVPRLMWWMAGNQSIKNYPDVQFNWEMEFKDGI